MKNKIYRILFTLSAFLIGPAMVFAEETAEYVGDNFCSSRNPLLAVRFVGYLLLFCRWLVPIAIIVMGTFDLFQAVTGGDEKAVSKHAKVLGTRILIGVLIFFFPTIVTLLISQLSAYEVIAKDVENCSTCLLNPSECAVPEEDEIIDQIVTTTVVHGGGGGSH